jgi:hypothetical protein
MILKATQISKKETTTQKIKFFSLQIQMLQNLQESQLIRGLPYFTNYHIYDHKTTSSTPRLCRFTATCQGGIYRPKEQCTWNKCTNNKRFREVIESSKGKATTCEDVVLEDSISKGICQHSATRDCTSI